MTRCAEPDSGSRSETTAAKEQPGRPNNEPLGNVRALIFRSKLRDGFRLLILLAFIHIAD